MTETWSGWDRARVRIEEGQRWSQRKTESYSEEWAIQWMKKRLPARPCLILCHLWIIQHQSRALGDFSPRHFPALSLINPIGWGFGVLKYLKDTSCCVCLSASMCKKLCCKEFTALSDRDGSWFSNLVLKTMYSPLFLKAVWVWCSSPGVVGCRSLVCVRVRNTSTCCREGVIMVSVQISSGCSFTVTGCCLLLQRK